MRTLLAFLALSSAAAAQVTVTGKVFYEDKTYTGGGFGATVDRPVRQARIELLSSPGNVVLNESVTDETGAYSLTFAGPDQNVRVRVLTQRATGKINAVVKNNAGAKLIYAVVGPVVNSAAPPNPNNFTITASGGVGGAFNIFDCAVKSFQYLGSIDIEPTLPDTPQELLIYWQPGTTLGTFFDGGVPAIFLLGETSDPDEYDDDIILHEIGHWVAFFFSQDDTPGGPHAITNNKLDPRLTWSEGWAHYWSAVVRKYVNAFIAAEYAAPNLQVDNFQGGNGVFDIEGPSMPGSTIWSTNEVAVAAVLWDLADPANEPHDTLGGLEATIWKSVRQHIPGRSNITLEDFHAGLVAEVLPTTVPEFSGDPATVRIFNHRQIRYYADPSEPNNSAVGPPALSGLLTQRTRYPAGDQDWFTVVAGPGTLVVETMNLGDGMDSLLQLYDSAGTTLLASHDNRSASDKSSIITRAVFLPTTFRVRLSHVGTIVEHGYCDVQAQTLANAAPVITVVSASPSSGSAPRRVTFDATVTDSDSAAHEFQWDFDNDGTVDWTSITDPRVTMTYDEPGSYTAQLRVIDSSDNVATSTVAVNVSSTSPAVVTITPTVLGGAAPLVVGFTATVTGVTPTAYLWDFDGDGVVDSASVTTAVASFTFRKAGTFTPTLIVRDASGQATRAVSAAITVTAGASPPTISVLVNGGTIPFDATFNITHSDLGVSGFVEFDVDADGRFDFKVAPAGAGGTDFVVQIQRSDFFFPLVRVTDSAGLTAQATGSMIAANPGLTGWLVDPRGGDRLSGTSVTLTAQAFPGGFMKSVQFQFRASVGPGAWTNIGSPVASIGTLFSTTWDVSGLAALASFDLRVLINGTASSGDTANTVVIDAAAPTITESGAVRTKTVLADRTTISRNSAGVWVIVPLGSTADALPLGLQPAVAPPAGGTTAQMSPVGGAWTVQFAGTFGSPFRLRLPFTGSGTTLEIHRFDPGASAWERFAFPRVSHDDGWVEADVLAPGIYSLFAPKGGKGGGGGCGLTGLEVLLLLGVLRMARRR